MAATSLLWITRGEDMPQINDSKQNMEEKDKVQETETWLRIQLEKIEKLQAGQTRADLLKLFASQGLFGREKATFVYQDCPLIKVDVEFEIAGEKQAPQDEWKKDVIKKISKPYLDRVTAYD